jgi:hypothetical protein
MAAAAMANSSLTAHTQALSTEELKSVKADLAGLIRKKGAEAKVIDEELDVAALPDYGTKGPDLAPKDFSSLQQRYAIDKVLVVEIGALGMVRAYSNYFPTSDPKAVLSGRGYIVNLRNNAYEWFVAVNVTKSAEGSWDEPPDFPGLTNAYFQALELGKDALLQPFSADTDSAARQVGR